MTLAIGCGRIPLKVNTSFSAPGPVGLGERIGNRVQLPSGTATVSVEAQAKGRKPVIGCIPRRRCLGLVMRKPGYLLRRLECQTLQVRGRAAFGAERRLRQFVSITAAAFLMIRCCICGFPLTIFLQIARQIVPACIPRGEKKFFPLFYLNSAAAVCRAAAAFVVMLWKKHCTGSSWRGPTAAAERPPWFPACCSR